MGLKARFLSIFLGVTLLHCCCALKRLPVYEPAEINPFLSVIDSITPVSPTFQQSMEKIITADTKTFESYPPDELLWKHSQAFAKQERKDLLTSKTERLYEEGMACLNTLNGLTIEGDNYKVLLMSNGGKRLVVVICGFGGNGFNAGVIALQLHTNGHDVIVVGLPNWDGQREKDGVFHILRRQFMARHMNCKSNPSPTFKYIELNSEDVNDDGSLVNNLEIPEGDHVYVEGHIGSTPDFTKHTKFPLVTIVIMTSAKENINTRCVAVDAAAYLHHTLGDFRFYNGNKIPSYTPNATVAINFFYPYVLTPILDFHWNSVHQSISIVELGVQQMAKVTFAKAIVIRLFTLLHDDSTNEEIKKKWKIINKTECPANLIQKLRKAFPLDDSVVPTQKYDSIYLGNQISKTYKATPPIKKPESITYPGIIPVV